MSKMTPILQELWKKSFGHYFLLEIFLFSGRHLELRHTVTLSWGTLLHKLLTFKRSLNKEDFLLPYLINNLEFLVGKPFWLLFDVHLSLFFSFFSTFFTVKHTLCSYYTQFSSFNEYWILIIMCVSCSILILKCSLPGYTLSKIPKKSSWLWAIGIILDV